MTAEERLESQRILAVLDAAHAEFGANELRRIAGPIRAAAGAEPMAETGEALRYPDTLYIPGLKSAAWHSCDWMPDTALLEAAAPVIRAELEALLKQRGGFQPFDEGEYGFNPTNTDGQWNVFYVVLGNGEVPSAAAACPKTAAALRTLPNLALSAMFSALTPGTHLWAHCGPTNAFISQSMGLIVPPGCSIRVGEEERGWQEGVCNVFDDTYEHEVWNRGSGTRFILLTDTWHPELTPVERKVLARVLWAPGEVEARLQHGKQSLQGKDWWEEAKSEK
jgi:aspartyl/asparaginyl beta-hydroxylase (cupin superfamily)